MATIRCVECGTEVNELVARCPRCGADPKAGFTAEERAAEEDRAPRSPVEQARAARESGREFLEIVLPFGPEEILALRATVRDARAEAAGSSRSEQLSAIEAEGWQLVGCSFVAPFLVHRADRVALIESASVEAESMYGVYLFRVLSPSPQSG